MAKHTQRRDPQEVKEITTSILKILDSNPKSSQVQIKKELKKMLGYEVSQPSVHRYLTTELGMEKNKERGWVEVERDKKQEHREKLAELLESDRVSERIAPVRLAILKLEPGYAGLFEAHLKEGYDEVVAGTVVLNNGLLIALKDNEEGSDLLSTLGFEMEK